MEPQATTQQDSSTFATISVTRGKEISGHPGHYWGRVDKTPRLASGSTMRFQWEDGMNLILRDAPHPHGARVSYPFGGTKRQLPIRGTSPQAAMHDADVEVTKEQFLGDDRAFQYLVYLSPQNTLAASLPDDWASLKTHWDVDHPKTAPGGITTLGGDDDDEPPEVIVMGGGGPGTRIDVKITIITPPPPVHLVTLDTSGHVTLDLKGHIVIIEPLVEDPIPAQEENYLWFIGEDETAIFTGSQGTVRVQLPAGSHPLILRHSGSPGSEAVKIVVEGQQKPLSLLQRILNFLRGLFGR